MALNAQALIGLSVGRLFKMSLFMPQPRFSVQFLCLWGLLWLFSASAFSASSEEPLGSTLEGLIDWIDNENPTLIAIRRETEAAYARVQPAGALPDPTLTVQFMNITNSDVTPDTMALQPNNDKEATMYTVAQTLPFWGKRDLREKVAVAQLSDAQAQQWATAALLYAEVKSAFAEWYQAIHLKKINTDTLDILNTLEKTAEVRYSQNRGRQQDVIAATLAKTSLQSELISLDAQEKQARARLNGVLNRNANASLAEPLLLPPIPMAELHQPGMLDRLINESPLLKSQTAQIIAAENNKKLVKKNRYPDITVGVSPIQQGDEIIEWGAMLELNLPIQFSTRRSQEHEANALLAAAKARKEAADHQIRSTIEQALAALNAAHQQDILLTETLLPQAHLSLETAVAGYRVGEVDFETVLIAQQQIQEIRQDSLTFQVEQQLSLAQMEQWLGAFL